jgi:hypothetical protein
MSESKPHDPGRIFSVSLAALERFGHEPRAEVVVVEEAHESVVVYPSAREHAEVPRGSEMRGRGQNAASRPETQHIGVLACDGRRG